MRVFLILASFYVAVWSTPIYYEFEGTVSSASGEATSYLNEEVSYLIMCDRDKEAYTELDDYYDHHSFFSGYYYFYVDLISGFVLENSQIENSNVTHVGLSYLEWNDPVNPHYVPDIPMWTTLYAISEMTMGTSSQQLHLLDQPNRYTDNSIQFAAWEVGKTVDGWETCSNGQIYSKLTLTSITGFNPYDVPEPTTISLLFIGLFFLYLTGKRVCTGRKVCCPTLKQ